MVKNMTGKRLRITYFSLLYLNWIGMLWCFWTLILGIYDRTLSVFFESPIYFALLIITLLSIINAYMLQKIELDESKKK